MPWDTSYPSGAGGPVAWGDITGKPSTFAPAAHEASHRAGGTDILSLANQAGTIATAQIAASAVTLAKIANIAANKVLGSIAGGAPAELTFTSAARDLADDADAPTMLTTLGVSYATEAEVHTGTATNRVVSPAELKPRFIFGVAASDETTALTTGTAKATFRMPFAMKLSSVVASVTTAPTGATIIVDINEGGTTILSTKLSIDATEKTSATAASAAVISDATLAADAEITVDIDQIGSTVAGAGLKIYLIGNRD